MLSNTNDNKQSRYLYTCMFHDLTVNLYTQANSTHIRLTDISKCLWVELSGCPHILTTVDHLPLTTASSNPTHGVELCM